MSQYKGGLSAVPAGRPCRRLPRLSNPSTVTARSTVVGQRSTLPLLSLAGAPQCAPERTAPAALPRATRLFTFNSSCDQAAVSGTALDSGQQQEDVMKQLI